MPTRLPPTASSFIAGLLEGWRKMGGYAILICIEVDATSITQRPQTQEKRDERDENHYARG
jgi:hypothetical protein